jgi:hypothetical protein
MSDETPASEIQDVQPGPSPSEVIDAPGNVGGGAGAPPAPDAPDAPAAPPAPEPPAPVDPVGAEPVAAPPPPPPVPQGALPAPPPTEQAAPSAEPKIIDADWPHVGYTGPQPWEAENPPALTQNHLMLSSGGAGDEVVELAALLAHLGYGTSISAGQNPHAIYDSGVSDAVRAFCADYGVTEDPQVRQARTEDTVGPWIWEALVRAAHKKIAEQATPA